ncbi:MAG: hypothetical protein KGP27_17830 [Hyphomicrobiales bacterium]|nr:hypothetical protein [Hyphomicrobiales bacterium]
MAMGSDSRRRTVIDAVAAGAMLLSVLALAGCANDGVELNGKVFDWMGVSESAKAAARREPRMAARSGIVLPPDASRLPEPGSGGQEPDITAEIADPDRKRVMAAAERERLHRAYCSGELTWKERTLKGERGQDTRPNASPYGSCSGLTGALN